MSLLEGGAHYEPCKVYLEESVTDPDGNIITRPSKTPVDALGRFQVEEQSGTSARRSERQETGFFIERFYRVRFPRSFDHYIGMQSAVEWRGQMWNVFGEEMRYTSSPRTRHKTYLIRRQ